MRIQKKATARVGNPTPNKVPKVITQLFGAHDNKCWEYVHKYWTGVDTHKESQHLYNICPKGMRRMISALITGKFNAHEREMYAEKIINKLGYIFGTADGKKLRNYINDVSGTERISAHMVFLVANMMHTSTVCVMADTENEKVNILKDVWIQQGLMKPSKYHGDNYYQVRARQKKLTPLLALCTDRGFEDEFDELYEWGVEQYLNKRLDAIINDTNVSIEAMVITGYIVRIVTTTFKMNQITSQKFINVISDTIMGAALDFNDEEAAGISADMIVNTLIYVRDSDFIQSIKTRKMSAHKQGPSKKGACRSHKAPERCKECC